MNFDLRSPYKPTGDQPEAIRQLLDGLKADERFQTLLGVTGSGKTFTVANVIKEINRPVLVLSHNKTLAAQLYGEFKQFFPNNAVEYFVSYYDYYQPEAYLPGSDTYIEKDLSINEEIDKLRLSATSALLSGRNDVIIVSSVSCIYGIGNPKDFQENIIHIEAGKKYSRNKLLHRFVEALYSRAGVEFRRGTFRVKGDVVDIFPAYADNAFRLIFWGDDLEEISSFDPLNGQTLHKLESVNLYPANIFVTTKESMMRAMHQIQDDLMAQVQFFRDQQKPLEAKRLEERTNFDLEMMRELGYCSGIENYSRYFDQREPGSRPFCLIDYFPEDYLLVIDESHVTIPQINGMYGGDRSRKINLVEYGFRLQAAMDNRPLTFQEFEGMMGRTIFVSATPADYELRLSEGVVVEQVIRPTGLLDPVIDVRPCGNQVDDLLEEIALRTEASERVLVTTLTKRMAEELSKFFIKSGIRCRYIHSDVDTLERVEILRDLRLGKFDVLVGINLLREGLDLPEVSLVAILDADKEGFLRSTRSLTQTAGRAARNVNGKVIMYADRITDSMRRTIDETERRRVKQLAYNEKHNITPTQITRTKQEIFDRTSMVGIDPELKDAYIEPEHIGIAADPVVKYMSAPDLEKQIAQRKTLMKKAAKELDFIEAARMRDEIKELEKLLNGTSKNRV
ncbi:MAG: excinuclease ABC subunit UvrB [Flavobacteriales bacterium]|nr:excinuclease ABC subunit UvrB [Flavobacteriales bacterium]